MTTWIASPTGTPDGDGSLDSPWDLTTALEDKTATVNPGDTIYLRGGTHTVPAGIDVNLVGEEGNPVIIKPYPGESATIDGNRDGEAVKLINIVRFGDGEYVRLQGCRVTNSSIEGRTIAEGGSNPDTARGIGIDVLVPGIEIVNCVLDNCGGAGLAPRSLGTAFLAYGNVIFDNGWNSTADGVHGHGIYTQSADVKNFTRNIIGQNFVYGVQAYGTAGTLDHFRFTRNVFFGSRSLIGGKLALTDCQFSQNIALADVVLGYTTSAGVDDVTFTNNRIASRVAAIKLESLTASGNIFYARGTNYVWSFAPTAGFDLATYGFSGNTYYRLNAARAAFGTQTLWVNEGVATYNYTTWPAVPQDADSTLNTREVNAADDYTQLDVNEYDDSRATLTIFNWGSADSVAVDLSEYAEVGDVIRVRNVQDYFGDVRIVQYTGNPVTIDMRAASHSVSTPIGYTGPLTTTSFPTYGVFVLEILSAASGGWRGIIRKALGWLVGDPTIPNPIPPAVVRRASPQDAASVRRGWLTPGSPIRRSPSTDNPVRRA